MAKRVDGRGRFAPSPTGVLHLGNLRTAVAAQMFATDGLIIRMEDLDRVVSSREVAGEQLSDLASIGIESCEEIVFQSDRFAIYEEHLGRLADQGLVYECFCTRREVREAAAAPHGDFVIYAGTCRNLTESERDERRAVRRPAVRLRVDDQTRASGVVDDVVLQRNDGVPAYNLAVVVDDELQRVTQVVRGIDLQPVTPSQQYLGSLLGFRPLEYVHVGLVVGPDGERLAKRHGAVTLADWVAAGGNASSLRSALEATLDDRFVADSCPIGDIWAYLAAGS
jgi:glutamyl-tRNA synthetase